MVALLLLVAPVLALPTMLFLARMEDRLAREAEDAASRPDPVTHPSA